MTSRWLVSAWLSAILFVTPAFAQRIPRAPRPANTPGAATDDTPEPPAKPSLRVLQARCTAITGAKVVTEPGKTLDNATIIVRDGSIEAIGTDLPIPPDAAKIDGKGLTVVAGFIDAGSHWGFDSAQRHSESAPAAPEDLASETLTATKADNRKGLTPEFTVGTALKPDDTAADAWRKAGFTTRLVSPEGGLFNGQSALVSLGEPLTRDSLLRPIVFQHASLKSLPGGGYPIVLMGAFAHARQTLLDAGHHQRQRAYFELHGRVGKRPPADPCLDALLPALEGKQSVVFEADGRDAIHRSLDFAAEFSLRPIILGGREAWKLADRLQRDEVPVIIRLTTPDDGERDKELPQRVRDDRKAKRDEEAQCAVKLRKAGVRVLLSTGSLPTEQFATKFREALAPLLKAGLSADDALRALTTEPAKLFDQQSQLGSIAVGKAANLVVMDGPFDKAATKVKYLLVDGQKFDYATPTTDVPAGPRRRFGPGGGSGGAGATDDRPAERPGGRSAEVSKTPFVGPLTIEETFSELESDRKPSIHTGGSVLLKNGKFITCVPGSPAIIAGDLLVTKGKIMALGPNLTAPSGHAVVELNGCFAMPGIVDTHCHFAVAGSVNEFSLSIVPEVRVRDVVEGDSVQIYRALAGGVTTARLLHGSANCVGGQDAVIKLKYGQPARDLIVKERPRGVKFALGENVKRTDGRFPNTRLGVEAVLIRAFSEAQEYRQVWSDYATALKEGKTPPEPRRDLRLEALADILRGDLEVHCHCYRSDEILMLLRVADKFGIKIKSLQHVLEGYKIAPEIAAHGASVSLFADWWAYKIEAFDAIPYAAALLHRAGAQVCLKSDDNELMRHMYQEAGKIVKYGGVPEADALRAITLTGANQIGVGQRVGSLEVGKDADIAIFNGHPLNGTSAVQMTLVEGEVYFQRSKELKPADYAQNGVLAAHPWTPPSAPVQRQNPFPGFGNSIVPKSEPDLLKERTFVIAGCTVHPVTGPTIENGWVVVTDGKIRGVASRNDMKSLEGIMPKDWDRRLILADGQHLYPGMIDAATVLGLAELESARETNDFAEGGDLQPDLRALIGVNPDSELIPVTRINGVLSVVTRPTGGLVSGQGALINLAGWTPRDMVVADPLALHVEFPASLPPAMPDGSPFPFARGLGKKQRDEKLRRLRELFAQAIRYDDVRLSASAIPVDPRLASVVPYARGQKPVIVQARRKGEIAEAVALADELKIKLIISGGDDAWKLGGLLKEKNMPVIAGPVMSLPLTGDDSYDAPMTNPARLFAAGVPFCIRSAGGSNTRNLPYEAAMAISYGLSPQVGLEAVTIRPAQMLGVADQLGSIEVGKRANLVLTTGDILQPTTQVLGLWIDGKYIEPTSKQTKLYDRYSQRLDEVKRGIAPLGTK